MSAGELLRNYPETFWLIHKAGRFAEQQAIKRAKRKAPVIHVKIKDIRFA